jgi:uncharacterized protein YihD (DUF1040 family)
MQTRESLMAALAEVWQLHPQWRFAQVVSNVAAWAGGEEPGELSDVTDDAMLQAAREHLRQQQSQSSAAAKTA